MGTTEQNSHALIMVVDDNTEFLSGMQLTLEMEGFNVCTATNGQEALDGLQAVSSGQNQKTTAFTRLPDLILSDIMMPVMDGYDFYAQVKDNAHLYRIPFIFLSAKSAAEDIRYGKELGTDDYLSKLCPPEDVLASIRGKLKRVEQQRFFELMSKRTEEEQQAAVDSPPSDGRFENRTVVLVAATIAILFIITLIFLSSAVVFS